MRAASSTGHSGLLASGGVRRPLTFPGASRGSAATSRRDCHIVLHVGHGRNGPDELAEIVFQTFVCDRSRQRDASALTAQLDVAGAREQLERIVEKLFD